VVRWLGYTKDLAQAPNYTYDAKNIGFSANDGALFREELLAAQIADLGCTVIAHRTETQRTVNFVERKLKIPFKNGLNQDLFSMGTDIKDACRVGTATDQEWQSSCLGGPYWNWGGLYSTILDRIQRKTWTGETVSEPFRADSDAIMKFELSPLTSLTGIGSEDAQKELTKIANDGYASVFSVGKLPNGSEGNKPYKFTGQRDRDKDGNADMIQDVFNGEVLSDDELGRMCWFVDGAVEFSDLGDLSQQTLVPAQVPYGLNESDPETSKKYQDVIQYIKSINADPVRTMDCRLN
jgi:hypothetical protein